MSLSNRIFEALEACAVIEVGFDNAVSAKLSQEVYDRFRFVLFDHKYIDENVRRHILLPTALFLFVHSIFRRHLGYVKRKPQAFHFADTRHQLHILTAITRDLHRFSDVIVDKCWLT